MRDLHIYFCQLFNNYYLETFLCFVIAYVLGHVKRFNSCVHKARIKQETACKIKCDALPLVYKHVDELMFEKRCNNLVK